MEQLLGLSSSSLLLVVLLLLFNSRNYVTAKHHIVLMVLDDMGRTDTGVYGTSNIPTPNIVNLAKQGVILDNFYTQTVCSPTRTALLTGRYPFRVGMQHITTQLPGMASGIPYDTPLIPEILADYESHHIGKHHVGYATWRHTPTRRGFNSFLGYHQGQIDYYAHEIGLATHGVISKTVDGLDLWDGHRVLRTAKGNYTLELYQKRLKKVVADYTLKYDTEERRKLTPLFLYFAHQIAHIPLESRKDEADRCGNLLKNRRVYCSMIVELDDAIGEFVNVYKQANLWDNTIVLVSTDNGGMVNFLQNKDAIPAFPASVGSNYPLRGSKTTLFEGGVRSLAFVTGGAVPKESRGSHFAGLVHAVDYTATILSIGGALPLRREELKIDGYDLVPALFHSVIWQRDHVPINVINGGKSYSAVRFGNYKVIINDFVNFAAQGWYDQNGELQTPAPLEQKGKTLLFDVNHDPTEREDLSQTHPELVQYGKDLIMSYVLGDEFMEPQGQTKLYLEAFPVFHGGAWKPFMSEERWQELWLEEVSKKKKGQGSPKAATVELS